MQKLCSLKDFDPPLKSGDLVTAFRNGNPARPVECVVKGEGQSLFIENILEERLYQRVYASREPWYFRTITTPFNEDDWL